jgi:hypothetical protein
MGCRQVRQRHSVMRMIGEIKLLLNEEVCLYSQVAEKWPSRKLGSQGKTRGLGAWY